jgi:hypothetical protein
MHSIQLEMPILRVVACVFVFLWIVGAERMDVGELQPHTLHKRKWHLLDPILLLPSVIALFHPSLRTTQYQISLRLVILTLRPRQARGQKEIKPADTSPWLVPLGYLSQADESNECSLTNLDLVTILTEAAVFYLNERMWVVGGKEAARKIKT